MILHCPLCHGRFSIEALVQDQAGRDLLALMARHGDIGPQLLQYLTLFRSESRALSFDRALKLAREVLEIPASPEHLAAAMGETVEALRGKGPLKNHNYLKRVLESRGPSTDCTGPGRTQSAPTAGGAGSRRKGAIEALASWAGDDWRRRAVAQGLAALVAANLRGAPAADTICYTADIWVSMLSTCTIPETDAPRIEASFRAILATATEWPEPRALRDNLPRRPPRARVRHEISEEQRAAGRDAARRALEILEKGGNP